MWQWTESEHPDRGMFRDSLSKGDGGRVEGDAQSQWSIQPSFAFAIITSHTTVQKRAQHLAFQMWACQWAAATYFLPEFTKCRLLILCPDCTDLLLPEQIGLEWLIGRNARMKHLVSAVLTTPAYSTVQWLVLIEDSSVINFPTLMAKLRGGSPHKNHTLWLHSADAGCPCQTGNVKCSSDGGLVLSRSDLLRYVSAIKSAGDKTSSSPPALKSIEEAANILGGFLTVHWCGMDDLSDLVSALRVVTERQANAN